VLQRLLFDKYTLINHLKAVKFNDFTAFYLNLVLMVNKLTAQTKQF